MPGGEPLPVHPPPDDDPDLLRRRARLDVLVRIGFWTTVSSVLLVVPVCLGCGFLMPEWAAPLVFLPAPLLFVCGGVLFITAQVMANRAHRCEVCTTWAEACAFSDPRAIRQCPRCGRWGVPGARARDEEEGLEKGHGFPVVFPDRPGESSERPRD